jgi:glycerol-1-phosphate dehydrogenase [NAD(P)+]
MRAMFDALLLTGVAMTLAETSAPASGGEHLISHTLDMMSSLDGRAHDLHGRQVGVGTILAAELYERVLAVESPSWGEPVLPADAAFWGPLAGEVGRQCAEKLPRLREARETLSTGTAWDELRAALAEVAPAADAIRECLRRAGAAWRADDIGCEPERLRAALVHAREIRSRFTVLDLAALAGVDTTGLV